MIIAEQLTKWFNGQPVLQGIDLRVSPGECVTIMGPNGAGKTTLLRILATLSRPSGGRFTIDGLAPESHANAIRQRVGLISHQPLLYEDLSAEENLRFYGRMYEVPDLERRTVALLERVGLDLRRYELVRTFSRGMKQRLAIARVLLHEPKVLLMDEPYTGLDEQAAAMLDELVSNEQEPRRTILLTTHDMERGLACSQRALILAKGRVVHQMDRSEWDPARFRQEYRRVVGAAR
jgi:heme exporter protein A